MLGVFKVPEGKLNYGCSISYECSVQMQAAGLIEVSHATEVGAMPMDRVHEVYMDIWEEIRIQTKAALKRGYYE
jgi:hypothetical protein